MRLAKHIPQYLALDHLTGNHAVITLRTSLIRTPLLIPNLVVNQRVIIKRTDRVLTHSYTVNLLPKSLLREVVRHRIRKQG